MPQTDISIINETGQLAEIENDIVSKLTDHISHDYSVNIGYINIVLLSDSEHTNLNIKHLGHKYSTDILTFDLSDAENINTDICINLHIAQENALEFKNSLTEELYRLIIHGILHMCGFDDHTPEEKAKMTELENRYLKVSCET
jgi:probable rRNA maturation factor